MHERYSHPALIFLVAYAIMYSKPWPAIVGCTAYFLNLERLLKHLNVSHDTFVFVPDFIAWLYLITIVLLFTDLYGAKLPRLKKRAIRQCIFNNNRPLGIVLSRTFYLTSFHLV